MDGSLDGKHPIPVPCQAASDYQLLGTSAPPEFLPAGAQQVVGTVRPLQPSHSGVL